MGQPGDSVDGQDVSGLRNDMVEPRRIERERGVCQDARTCGGVGLGQRQIGGARDPGDSLGHRQPPQARRIGADGFDERGGIGRGNDGFGHRPTAYRGRFTLASLG